MREAKFETSTETSLDSPQGRLRAMEEMLEEMEDEEWEKPAATKLPSFTPAGIKVNNTKKKTEEEREASPPLSSSNILTSRPTNSLLKNREVSGGLSRQYDGMGGRSRQLFHTEGSLSSAMKLKALAAGPSQGAKKKKTMPLTQKPNKQMKTLDKFFGSFDTP